MLSCRAWKLSCTECLHIKNSLHTFTEYWQMAKQQTLPYKNYKLIWHLWKMSRSEDSYSSYLHMIDTQSPVASGFTTVLPCTSQPKTWKYITLRETRVIINDEAARQWCQLHASVCNASTFESLHLASSLLVVVHGVST